MADYVNVEVARDRLRKACKGGTILAVIVLLLGLCYGGLAAIIAMDVSLPFEFMYAVLATVVPTYRDTTLATADCGTKAVLLVLVGFLGILMFHKAARTGEAFRLGQMRQLKFIAFLIMLLGFLPSLVGNILKVGLAVQSGTSAMAVISIATEPMCVLAGLFMFLAARMLVRGAQLAKLEGEPGAARPASALGTASYDSMAPATTTMPEVAETTYLGGTDDPLV